jgi:hypothetical protein
LPHDPVRTPPVEELVPDIQASDKDRQGLFSLKPLSLRSLRFALWSDSRPGAQSFQQEMTNSVNRPGHEATWNAKVGIVGISRWPLVSPRNCVYPQTFSCRTVAWNSVLAPTFTVDEISVLQVALDSTMTEATAKGFDYPLDLMLRRLFEAAEIGERDPEKLKALVLAGWNVAKDSPV